MGASIYLMENFSDAEMRLNLLLFTSKTSVEGWLRFGGKIAWLWSKSGRNGMSICPRRLKSSGYITLRVSSRSSLPLSAMNKILNHPIEELMTAIPNEFGQGVNQQTLVCLKCRAQISWIATKNANFWLRLGHFYFPHRASSWRYYGCDK